MSLALHGGDTAGPKWAGRMHQAGSTAGRPQLQCAGTHAQGRSRLESAPGTVLGCASRRGPPRTLSPQDGTVAGPSGRTSTGPRACRMAVARAPEGNEGGFEPGPPSAGNLPRPLEWAGRSTGRKPRAGGGTPLQAPRRHPPTCKAPRPPMGERRPGEAPRAPPRGTARADRQGENLRRSRGRTTGAAKPPPTACPTAGCPPLCAGSRG